MSSTSTLSDTKRKKNRERQRRYRAKNKDKVNAKQRERYSKSLKRNRNPYQTSYRQKNKLQLKDAKLRRIYGISLEQRGKMFSDQGGVCAICKTDTPTAHLGWVVDHCHSTGKVRGILCSPCNSLLGYARDNAMTLSSAIKYLS